MDAFLCIPAWIVTLNFKLMLHQPLSTFLGKNKLISESAETKDQVACSITWPDELVYCMQGDFNPFCCARAGPTIVGNMTYNGGMDL